MIVTKSLGYAVALAAIILTVIAGLVVFVIAPLVAPLWVQHPANKTLEYTDTTVYYFYGEGCPHCANVEPSVNALEEKYPAVTFMTLEIWHNQTNRDFYERVNKKIGQPAVGVPEVVIGGIALIGDKEIPDKLERAIINQSTQVGDMSVSRGIII